MPLPGSADEPLPGLCRDADGGARRRREQDPSGRGRHQGPVPPAAGRGREDPDRLPQPRPGTGVPGERPRLPDQGRGVQRHHAGCLHRTEDGRGAALPHDHAPDRVRHVLQPVTKRLSFRREPESILPSPQSTAGAVLCRFCLANHELALQSSSVAPYWQAVLGNAPGASPMKSAFLVPLALLLAASLAQAQGTRIYRCGNSYTNDTAQAQAQGCKLVEGGNVTVVEGTKVNSQATVGVAAVPSRSEEHTSELQSR